MNIVQERYPKFFSKPDESWLCMLQQCFIHTYKIVNPQKISTTVVQCFYSIIYIYTHTHKHKINQLQKNYYNIHYKMYIFTCNTKLKTFDSSEIANNVILKLHWKYVTRPNFESSISTHTQTQNHFNNLILKWSQTSWPTDMSKISYLSSLITEFLLIKQCIKNYLK